jgi:hypothetical protein
VTTIAWSSPDAADPVAGLFQAPLTPGVYHVVATVAEHPSRTATAVVTVHADVDVAVTPGSPGTLQLGDQVQFSAAVTGGATNAVTWTATGGDITADGLFTATIIGLASVTATSVEDPERSSSVIFEIGGEITITITPGHANVTPGGTQQFTATVNGAADQRVEWMAHGGTIDSTGLFTAGTAIGSRYYVLVKSVALGTNGDPAWGQASIWVYPPFEVNVWPDHTHAVLNSFAQALDWGELIRGSGDCDGNAGIYQRVTGLEPASFSCTAMNAYGDTSHAETSTSGAVADDGLRVSGGAALAIDLTAEGDASGLYWRAEGMAESTVRIVFEVTAPMDYAIERDVPGTLNTCTLGRSDAVVSLGSLISGVSLPDRGTLNPGNIYVLEGTARVVDGQPEGSCAGSASFDGTLSFSPPDPANP